MVFLVAAGDPAPAINEAHYLCRLKHYWAAGPYCPGDLFLESPDAHFTVVWLFGWVTRLVSLEATAWIGRLLSWGVLAAGLTRLARRVSPAPLLAPLAAAGLVYGTRELNLAGEWIVGGFEAKSLAYGFVLLALVDALDGRWNRAWLGLGFASAMHALVGGWSVLALGAAAVLTSPRPALRSMLPGLLGGGALALLGVVPPLLMNAGTPAGVVAEAHQIYVYDRLPHHLSLLTMREEWLTNRAVRHASVLAGLVLLTALRWRAGGPAVRRLVAFAWAAEAISAAGLAISLVGWEDREWAASLLRFYWHRLADVATPLAVLAALMQWIGAGLHAQRRVAALAVTIALLLAGGYLASFVYQRANKPFAAADGVMHDPRAWIAMQDWIRENAPPDAVFLVPRRSHTFKWRAERAEVVSHKDIPQDAASMVAWRDRLEDVYVIGEWPDGSRRMTRSLASLGAARLRELGAEYGADFALDQAPRREVGQPLRRRASLPVLHREGPYTLYDLRTGGGTNPR